MTFFCCIIKQFHPPSWRLCGPETGFCKKIPKFWPFLIFLSKFSEKSLVFWPNFRQNLTKFVNFFCIIKQFHPPSWRLCGPETGFCQKKYQNFDQISHFFVYIWPHFDKIDKIWSEFDKILTEFDKISTKFDKIYQNFD